MACPCWFYLHIFARSCSFWKHHHVIDHFGRVTLTLIILMWYTVNPIITHLKNHRKWVVPSPNGSYLYCLWHWAYHINHHLSVTWWRHPYNFPSSQPSGFDFNIFSTDAIVAAQAQAMLRETETEPAWAVGKKGDTMSVHISV